MDASAVGLSVRGRWLLQGVSLTIRPNELVALVGGSGAGKSTRLKALAGVSTPTTGRVLYNGTDLYAAGGSFRSVIGYVSARATSSMPACPSACGALDHVARLRLPPDLTAGDRQRRIIETLAAVDMAERQDSIIGTLSGGERKRVSVALELLANPKVLLLDEPTSGLDAGLDKRLMELLRRLADEGRYGRRRHPLGAAPRPPSATASRSWPAGAGGDQCPPAATLQHFGAADFADAHRAVETWEDHLAACPAAGPGGARRRAAAPARAAPGRRPPARRADDAQPRAPGPRPAKRPPPAPAGAGPRRAPRARRGPGGLHLGAAARPATVEEVAFALAMVAVWFGLINAAREISKERPIAMREQLMGVRALPNRLLSSCRCSR